MGDHETVLVPIKFAEVDKGIVPVVKWLNGFSSVCTFHSCEGDRRCKPYVLFVMDMDWSRNLDIILQLLNRFAEIEISYDEMRRYTVRFRNRSALKKFVKMLNHITKKNEGD